MERYHAVLYVRDPEGSLTALQSHRDVPPKQERNVYGFLPYAPEVYTRCYPKRSLIGDDYAMVVEFVRCDSDTRVALFPYPSEIFEAP